MSTVINSIPPASFERRSEADERTWELFRRWGYLEARLDPLGQWLEPARHPELRDLSGAAAARARQVYCGSIGVEFMHLPDPERRRWLIEQMENPASPSPEQPAKILDALVRADLFEQVLQARYLGTKRFSLEGVTALIPLLETMLEGAAEHGAQQVVIGMSHRGRLNVMQNIVGRDASEIFANFEDMDPRSVLGSGDVKYHIGSTGTYRGANGTEVQIHLASNPSHLEAVDPVALGRTRAKQVRLAGVGGCAPGAGDALEAAREKVVPILVHGDAAMAGQGIVAETLNLASLRGFNVGGTIHIIGNNLIGFTANPPEISSSRFATDVAKRLPIPIFHVNGEDLEAVVRVGRMALEWRYAFGTDVVVDVIGYRRHGHSEVEDASITQPVLYEKIKKHPRLHEIYAASAGLDLAPVMAATRQRYEEALAAAKKRDSRPVMRTLPAYWSKYVGGPYRPEHEVDTGLPAGRLRELAEALARLPEGFHVHPKIKRLLDERLAMGSGKRPVDYGMAEAMSFASLVADGTPVRLSGQDSRRGTFNQRHAVLVDTENESIHIPLCHIAPSQASFKVYSSELSEAAVMGFEYGYSRDYPECGRRSSATSPTERRSSSTSSSWRARTSGNCSAGWCCCCRTATRARDRSTPAPVSSAFCNWRPRTTSRSASPRTPPSISTCCGVRRCGAGASLWWCSRRKACCGIRTPSRRSRISHARVS